jgi:hypothetical protein
MKKIGAGLLVLATALTLAATAFAHNRAHVILPDGTCMIVGSEKSVTVPDGTRKASVQPDGVNVFLDLRPETYPADEIGTAFAADEGNSRLEKGPCPES